MQARIQAGQISEALRETWHDQLPFPPHTLSTILNPLDASGRLSRLMAASSPGAFMAPRQPHPTRRFTTCTCSAAAGRSTVDRLTFRAVTRTLSFDQT